MPADTPHDHTPHVRSELSGRRLLIGLALLAVIPLGLGLAALQHHDFSAPPTPKPYSPLKLTKPASAIDMQARELGRSRAAMHKIDSAGITTPTVLPAPGPDSLPTLVLPPRDAPYTLAELVPAYPHAFRREGSSVLVLANLEIPRGATLVIDGDHAQRVLLSSSPAGFVSIVARGGVVDMIGGQHGSVDVTSWNPTAKSPDENTDDGRAFVLTVGGRIDLSQTTIEHLGFGIGTTSGIAWRGSSGNTPVKATGRVVDSTFEHNWYGSYTFEAQAMHWEGNTFAYNDAYGFDPHDLSNNFLVQNNVAHDNGRHGFIFSRGCTGNVMRNNVSYSNAGHGFMLDDGRSKSTDFAKSSVLTSDDNLLVGNRAYDNAGTGIEIEGGTGNVVRDNVVRNNHVGVRVKNDAQAKVVDNTLRGNRLYGVDVFANARHVTVADNTITRSWAGISVGKRGVATLKDNASPPEQIDLVVDGTIVRHESWFQTVARYVRWHPLLMLWSVVFGVPLIVALVRGGRAVLPARRGRRHLTPRHAGLSHARQ
ncbi:right-handed parallel beta-helix repeat-containing protein [Isoptericola sp. b441]|uniref:Right-handed parallel beta-helix repeat-containing protein n=1 Tax=Actinotalea lenta TaxID=3064654 RepID=A0ABT9DD71_9CELL|nr:right-handed parallel beta-helix repeat-containing protein [Isoptericola sp. b441]MDO8107203.1 right-handed parallel beta-helix repeat-containing protein [Isoptericola sp. b441]